ncbi:hypothetical protein VTO73DRAFT_8674 [Trametes versicolor]
MNVNQLHPQPPPQLQRTSTEASEKEADFLALRLLNKRSRLRLSPQPLDLDVLPAKARIFAVANRAGWCAAAIRNADGSYALVLSPLNDLHSVFSSSTSDGLLSLQSRVSLPLPAIPHIVVFTQDDARLLVAFASGPLSVYDSQAIFQSSAAAPPLHTFPFSGRKPVRDIFPSPGDMQTVALVREAGDGLPVEIIDVQKLVSIGGWNAGGSPATNPTSVSWSPKGKQIAIGLESGDIVTFSPTDTSTVKSVVPKPQSLDGQSIISTTWLSNTEFHAIYAPVGQMSPDVEQSHYVLSLESKSSTAGDVKLACPYLPFPGVRPPGSFVTTLRNWEPSRLLLFVGDGTSSDIGVLGSLTDSGASTLGSWFNLTLEETSTPTVPLDSDMNETVLLGLELDLTNDQPYKYTGPSGEDMDVPPSPIMYLYASDGTLTGWHIIQTQGVAYPGMMATRSASAPSISPATSTATDSSAHSAFAAPAPASAQPSVFGGANNAGGGFGAFSGAPAKFGGPPIGFGAQTSPTHTLQAPPMSAPSVSVEMASATEDTMVSEADGGLGGMSLGGGGESSQPRPGAGTSSMFGSFGAPQQQSAPSSSPFGGSGPTSNSTFATFGAGPVKPPTGFGAFGGGSGSSSGFGSGNSFGSGGSGGFGSGSGSAFGGGASAFSSKPAGENGASNPAPTDSKPTSAFGQTSFGQSGFGQSGLGSNQSTSAFGQSAFGQSGFGQPSVSKPAFGQSAFGNTSFGATTTPAKPPPSSAFGSGSSGGGFAAFAAAPASFASAAQQKTPDAKPVWAASGSQAVEQKPQEAPSSEGTFGGGNAFGAKPAESTTSPFGSAKPTDSASSAFASTQPAQPTSSGAFGGLGQGSAFGKSSFGQSSFGQSSFGQSSFGQPSTGQSAFGQSAFGQSATPATTPIKPATTPSGGGFASFATAGPSAFSTAAAQKSPSNEAKPVWATAASEDKPKEAQEQPKSVFGTSPSAASAFGGSSSAASSASTTSTTPASTPEKTATPVTPAATPPATPAPKPATIPTTSTTPATPAPGGAFGGLTTSTNAFSKLQSGFGAFGNIASGSSAFSQKPAATPQPSAFFGQTSFGAAKTPENKDSSSTPAFGAPSPLGSYFGKSSFGSSPSPFGKPAAAPSTPTPSTSTNTSAFSAFSNTANPFAAAASGPKKSFGDMLREKEDGEKEEPRPQGVSKTAEEWKKPVSVFASLKQAAAEKKGEEEDEEEAGNVSFRSQDDDDDVYAEDGSDGGDDGIDDFLKSDEEEEDGSEEEEEEEESAADGVQSQTPPDSPTAKQPLSQQSQSSFFVGGVFLSKDAAKSRTSSSPPPVPIVKVEPESPKGVPLRRDDTPPPDSPTDRSSVLTEGKGKGVVRETSTTPPGSPVPAPPATRATSAPPPSSPAPGPGLLGVGRPSTRPTRSSPLANQPISGDDASDEEEEVKKEEDDDDDERETSPAKKARSASPAVSTVSRNSPAQQPTTRPKTPPLLFGLGGPVKPPTPSPFSLTPSLFGAKPSTPPAETPAEPSKPSPPGPSLKGPGTPGTPSIFNAPPVFSPPATTQGGFFGQKSFDLKPAAGPPGGTLFGSKLAPPTAPQSTASPFSSPGFFSTPILPSPMQSPSPAATSAAAPAAVPPSAPLFGGSAFGAPTQAAKPSPFGGFAKPATLPATATAPVLPAVPIQPPPPSQAAVAQGMQTECLYLFSSLAKELEDLKALATRASARATQLNKPGSGNKTAQDLLDPTKWILGDLSQFKEIMKEVEREVAKWEKEKATVISAMRELESDMLKATTRKEEIARFHRASQDTEFARMLKARTLSPEHLETQAQLRREIRTMRGRIQQLEDHIQASKKKLNSVKNGKPTLKPPSLDTINRTYRNIDIAIEQEEEGVSSLAERVAQLNLSSQARGKLSFATSSRDKRLPDRTDRIGREVTPNIAASTAAALNAERSAQKLKRALLKARKEPLLNTKAVDALPPAREIRSSRKPLLSPESGLDVGAAFAAGMNGFLPGTPGTPTPAAPVWTAPPPGSFGMSPAWSPSPPFVAEQSPPSSGRSGAMRPPKDRGHGRSAQPSQPTGFVKPPSLPPPAGFSWGPLPKFESAQQTIPGFSSFSNIKAEATPAVKVKEEEKDLGSSWIADGFGALKK